VSRVIKNACSLVRYLVMDIYDPYRNTSSVLLAACIERCIATVAARTTENTAPVLLVACVLPSNGSTRQCFYDFAVILRLVHIGTLYKLGMRL
jgi:hypothetical protein